MKTFKQSLQEKSDWRTWILSGTYYPLSTLMLERIFKKLPEVTVFHITSPSGLNNLIKLENTRKSISTFSKSEQKMVDYGVETSGGIVVKVKGKLLSKGKHDIYSAMDSQGRRWLDIAEEGGNDPDMRKVMEKIKNSFYKKITNEELNEKTDWWKLGTIVDAYGKQKFVKTFFDVVEEVSKKHMTTITNFVMGKDRKYNFSSHYNELVVNQFKILKIYVNSTADNIIGDGDLDYIVTEIGAKYNVEVSKSKEIYNDILKTKTI